MEILFENMPCITDEEVSKALCFSKEQVVRNLPVFTDKFQKAYSEGKFYQPVENDDWTNGFWTGEIWLSYEYAKNIAMSGKMAVRMRKA